MNENVSKKVYTLKEREENLKEALRNGGFIGDNGTWNSIMMFAGDSHVYRHRVETLIIKDLEYVYLKFDEKGNYHLPGGSVEKDLPLYSQAVNECNEEAHINVRNIESTGISYKKHVPVPKSVDPNDNFGIQWNGEFSEIFIGEYDGKYNKKIDDEDQDPFILSGKFYPIKDVIGKLIPEHKTAIMNYMKLRSSDEFNEKSEFNSYYSCTPICFFGDVHDFGNVSNYLSECACDSKFNTNEFYTSIESAIENCDDKTVSSFIVISSPKDTLSGKILDINNLTGRVIINEEVEVTPIKLVKMIDDNNYRDMSAKLDEDDLTINLYYPTTDNDDLHHKFDNQLFFRDYENGFNYSIYLSLHKTLQNLNIPHYRIKSSELYWDKDKSKICCSSGIFNKVKNFLHSHNIYGHIYSLKVPKNRIQNDDFANIIDPSNKWVLFSFIITPLVFEDSVDIIKNPVEAIQVSNIRKYCIIDKFSNNIPVSDNLSEIIRFYIDTHKNALPTDSISVVCSDFFDVDAFKSYSDIDGYPVKKITKPLYSWCSQCKLTNRKMIEESTNDSKEDKAVEIKISIDLESTVIMGYLMNNFKLFNDLYGYFSNCYDKLRSPNNTNADAVIILDKIDKIMSNIKDELDISHPLFISSCNKVIKICKDNEESLRFARMNFNSIYSKYKKVFKKYDELLEKSDNNIPVKISNIGDATSTTDKTKFTRFVNRLADAYRVVGNVYMKLDDIMNPKEKVKSK